MNHSENVTQQLEQLNQNIKDLTLAIRELVEIEKGRKKASRSKGQPVENLSEDQRTKLKTEFENLYVQWSSGNEFEVRRSLEAMDLDALRLLADVGNVTGDKKASKDKVLRAFITRFREMKMLREGITNSRSRSDDFLADHQQNTPTGRP